MHENRSLYPVAKALAAALLFGASAPISKALLGDVEPIPLAAFLYLGSGISALLLLWLQRPKDDVAKEASISRADLPWLVGAVFFGGVAAPILLMFSLRETPAASAALLLNFESIATTAIAWAVFHEAVGRRAWGGVLLITLSSIVLSWQPDDQWGLSLGALGIIAACTLWGVDNNLTRKISAKNPLSIVMIKGLGAGSCSLVLAFVAGQAMPAPFHAISAMLLGSLSYGLSITLFILALRDLGAARTSALFSTSPFIGSLLAFLIFREAPTVQFILAFVIMCGGTWLLAKEKHCHRHYHPPLEHDHRHRHDDGHHTHTHLPDEVPPDGTHSHPHVHEAMEHTHSHTPDIHHQH